LKIGIGTQRARKHSHCLYHLHKKGRVSH
jgi:hypothetical protein